MLTPLESDLSLHRDVKLVSLDGQVALKKMELEETERKINETKLHLG